MKKNRLIVAHDTPGNFPITVDQSRSFDFRAISCDGSQMVLVGSSTITQVTYADAFEQDFSSLLFAQIVGGAKFFQFVTVIDNSVTYKILHYNFNLIT